MQTNKYCVIWSQNSNFITTVSVPLVQKKTLEDVTWVTKPNTRFTASVNNNLADFDSQWPLNLRLTEGYRIDPVNNTLTFSFNKEYLLAVAFFF